MRVFTVGHGRKPAEELVAQLRDAGAETDWRRCHRRLIADLLVARGHGVVHLIRPGETEEHRLPADAEARAGVLHLCGVRVA